jgi:hypothetical protein
VTPDEPSWYDYILGKNRAKLVSVKNNLRSISGYVMKHNLKGNDGTFKNLFLSNSWQVAMYSNNAEWCAASGVPENCLDSDEWPSINADATPIFKTQYKATSNGWWGCYRLLTNALWFYDPGTIQSSLYGPTYFGFSSNSYEEAYANASITFTNGYRGERVDYQAYYSGGYKVDIDVGGGITNVFSGKTTNIAYSVEVYFKGYSPFVGSNTFNALGSGYVTNYNLTAEITNGFYPSDLVLFQKTTYYPDYIGPGSFGWMFQYGSVGVFKFDGANGFKYK